MKVLALLLLIAACSLADHQTAPGTTTRPILTASEAASYTKAAYLQGWSPLGIDTTKADYIVGSGHYSTIQAAINDAIKAGGSTRKYIKISAGTYNQLVYVPTTSVPLTFYGDGSTSSQTVITLSLSANTPTSTFKSTYSYLFKSGDPAYSMFSNCADKSGTIGTSCSPVFSIKASNVEIDNLTVENSSKDGQSVAIKINGDQFQANNCRFLGHQDTLYAGSGGTGVQRSFFTKCYITGDTDFIFGGGTAIFQYSVIKAVSTRRTDGAVIFAPSTDPKKKYGFLVIGSTITGDSTWISNKNVHFARGWDSGVPSAGDYKPGTYPNGQVVIRETTVDLIINVKAPYETATSGRTFSGDISSNRNLDDDNYNRFWEYANKGNGA